MTFRERVLGVRMTEPKEQEQKEEEKAPCPRPLVIPPILDSVASTDPRDYKTVTQRSVDWSLSATESC